MLLDKLHDFVARISAPFRTFTRRNRITKLIEARILYIAPPPPPPSSYSFCYTVWCCSSSRFGQLTMGWCHVDCFILLHIIIIISRGINVQFGSRSVAHACYNNKSLILLTKTNIASSYEGKSRILVQSFCWCIFWCTVIRIGAVHGVTHIWHHHRHVAVLLFTASFEASLHVMGILL